MFLFFNYIVIDIRRNYLQDQKDKERENTNFYIIYNMCGKKKVIGV